MKLKLYKISQGFVLASDERVTGKGYGLEFDLLWQNPKLFKWESDTACSPESNCRKVIALPGEIDFSGLSEANQKKIGWIDVEKLYPTGQAGLMSMPTRDEFNNSLRQEGFQKAQELLSDRKFTLEDINKAYDEGLIKYFNKDSGLSRKGFIESLSKNSWKVEIEMEEHGRCKACNAQGLYHCAHPEECGSVEIFQRPKFTDGKIKILNIL